MTKPILDDVGADFARWLGRWGAPARSSERLLFGMFARMLAVLLLVAVAFWLLAR